MLAASRDKWQFLLGCGWQSHLCWFAEKPPKTPIYQYYVHLSGHLHWPTLVWRMSHSSLPAQVTRTDPPILTPSPAAPAPVCPLCWMSYVTHGISGGHLSQQTSAVPCLVFSSTVLLESPADIIHVLPGGTRRLGELAGQWYSYLSIHISAMVQMTHIQCYSCFRVLSLFFFFFFFLLKPVLLVTKTYVSNLNPQYLQCKSTTRNLSQTLSFCRI